MMSPSGFRHGRIAATIARILGESVVTHDLGAITGAETGFLLEQSPDTVRAPDVGFVAKDRIPITEPTGFFEGCPDLAVEVLSPNDRAGNLLKKVHEWLRHGCLEVWVVDPEANTVSVYLASEASHTYQTGETLRSLQLPGFECQVDALFG